MLVVITNFERSGPVNQSAVFYLIVAPLRVARRHLMRTITLAKIAIEPIRPHSIHSFNGFGGRDAAAERRVCGIYTPWPGMTVISHAIIQFRNIINPHNYGLLKCACSVVMSIRQASYPVPKSVKSYVQKRLVTSGSTSVF